MQSTSFVRANARWRLALALGASSLLSTTSAAQDAPAQPAQPAQPIATRVIPPRAEPEPSIEWKQMPDAVQTALDSSTSSVLFDTAIDGATWARGNAYKARFGADGVTVVPFFGSDAPQNYPLEMRATLVGATAAQTQTPAQPVTRSGDTVRIDRGAFVEEYDLTTESLEQRFVFERLPSSGDVVVRLDTASELAGSDLGATLRFENDLGRIDYGQAFALDADGARIELDSTLVDGEIELRVPSGFAQNAALPLVIDPLITFYTASSSSKADIYPDVSYDVSSDRWCIVWANVWSQSDHDAYARFASGNYTLDPNLIELDFTSDTWTTPKVANNNGSNSFLVSFAVVPPSGVAYIGGRFVLPPSGVTGAPFPISPLDGAYRNWPDIGGDPFPGSSSYFCVVWQRYVSASNVDIEGRLVAPDGSLLPIIPIENGSALHRLPSISRSTGDDVGDGTVGWTVTWEHEYSTSDHDIWGAQISWGGSILHAMFPIETSAWDETRPVASTMLDSTGFGAPRPYMVAFERNYGDHDLMGTVMQANQALATKNLVGDFDAASWYGEQTEPAIDSDGQQFLLAFTERLTPGGYDTNVWVCDYFWDGQTLGACEVRKNLAGTPAAEGDAAVHSMASSGGVRQMYLAPYVYESLNQSWDVIGALWQGCGYMVESVCDGDGTNGACPCGTNGANGHGCANSAHAEGGLLTFAGDASVSANTALLQASSLPPNAACLFFQGSSLSPAAPFGNGLRCVTGATLRYPLAQCDLNGDVSYPHAGQLSVSAVGQVPALGGTRYYQAWYRDPAAACASTSNVTNALRVTWVP